MAEEIEDNMTALIEALTIFGKYMKENASPIHCEHDIMYVMVLSDVIMDPAEVERLDELGFFIDEESDTWASFRFGSA